MLRKLGRALAVLLGLIVLLIAGAFAYAQTQWGRNQIAGLVAELLGQPGQPAQLSGLSGLLPFDIRLASLRLRDADGVWFEVDDARLEISPTALLHGEIAIAQIGARRIALDRLRTAAPEPPAPFALPRLPQLPSNLPRVSISRLFVDALELAAPVMGEAAVFALDGHAATGPDGDRVETNLALRRTDQPTARLDLAAGLDLPASTLRVDLQGSETGGLLAAATGRPQAGDLRLSLTGDGPLAGWQGKLAVDAERLAKLDLAVDLAYAEHKRIAIAGALDAAPNALPLEIADIIGTHADLTVRAGETAPQQFAVEELTLRAASVAVTGTGSADLAADKVQGTLAARVPDLAPLSTLAATPLAGSAELKLTASGAARQPVLDLAVTGAELRAANLALSRLTSAFTVAFSSPLGEGPLGLSARGGAATDGLALDGRLLADGRVELALEGDLPARGDATVRELALRSSLGEVTATAHIDRSRLAGTGRVDGSVPDLAKVLLALAANSPLAGAVQVGADIDIGEGARRFEITLEGGASGLTGLPPGAQDLVGSNPTLQAKATVVPKDAASVHGLVVEGAGFRMDGDPRYGLADRWLGGELRVAIPDLGRLQPALGEPIAGAAALRAALGGTVDVPEVKLDATLERLAIAGQSIDRVTLGGDLKGPLDAPAGSAKLTAAKAKQQVSLATGYRLAGDVLALTGLTLDAPATRLAGNAEVALGGPLVRGQLAGEAKDLAALASWTGQKLAGAAKLDLRLTTPQGRQDAVLKLDATGIAGDFGTVRSAGLAATLTDALGRGGIDATLRASGVTAPDLEVADATVGVGGRLAALDITATATGSQGGRPFDLNTAAALDVLGQRKIVRVSRLAGTIAGESLRLAQPATITLDGASQALDGLDLALGPARLQGKLDLGPTKVQGEMTLAALPLAALEKFGAPPLAGTAQARLGLTGTRGAPELAVDATATKVALDPGSKVKVDARLDGNLRGGRLGADLALSGLGSQPLTVRASLPTTFTLQPAAFALSDTASLSGRIAGPIDLARVAQLVALGGTQVAGVLQTALDLSGTVRQPALAGTLNLDGGSVQDIASGVVLRKVGLQARAAGDQLTIEQLTATDPTGGTLNGKGAVRLLAGGGLGYDVSVDAKKARVLDNTLGVVVLSGNLGATGDLGKALARGRLTVDRADIQIPDGGGPSVPVMAVKEVNRAGGDGATKTAAAPAVPLAVAFDIGVDIPGRLFVRGRGLDSEWNGQLSLTGDLVDPLVKGELNVRRGYFDLLDRRFTIDRGALDFVGSRPPIPMIDIAASAKTVEVNVTVALQGPARDPKITLSSEPTLPQDEILARLLFGTSAARITPMQGLRLAAAVQELQGGSFVSGALTKFRRAVGVDTLDMQSTETTDAKGETTQQTSARVGKYVTDKVYIEVEQGVTDGGSKARVQVDLTPNLSVGSTVNDQSQTGVGLQWRYDY